jgi:phosphoribosylamine--glycine ligase
MNVLVLGSGGREHAFAWKIAQSKKLSNLYIAPGNAGTSACGENINVSVTDFEGIKKIMLEKDIDLVVVGPEDPLVKGIVAYFKNDALLKDVAIIGPSKEGAMLEGSKDVAKAFMQKHNIPTARYQTFDSSTLNEAKTFLKELQSPYVLKADGLAAGKGVLILDNIEEAEKELDEMLLNAKFGEASAKVVIEEFLNGIELSIFVLTDGKNYKVLPAAKDYKRIGEGDTGLNTGGMGAISPVPFADESFLQKVEERIIKPTVQGFEKDNIDYKGFVFIGLMNVNGDPFVIEYNVRMGDPETEAVLPRIESDLLETLEAVANQKLNEVEFKLSDKTAATVIMVSGGYPEAYEKGKEISGLDKSTDSIVFHAGTKFNDGKVLTSGGRVLAITSLADNMEEALQMSYKTVQNITFEGVNFRKDIGQDLKKYFSEA